MKTIDTGKNTKKCETCTWRIVMSYCDVGGTSDPAVDMCHYAWKRCDKVWPNECHYKLKKSEVPRNE